MYRSCRWLWTSLLRREAGLGQRRVDVGKRPIKVLVFEIRLRLADVGIATGTATHQREGEASYQQGEDTGKSIGHVLHVRTIQEIRIVVEARRVASCQSARPACAGAMHHHSGKTTA